MVRANAIVDEEQASGVELLFYLREACVVGTPIGMLEGQAGSEGRTRREIGVEANRLRAERGNRPATAEF